MAHECGNHGRFHLLKSISKKYIQDHLKWSKIHIERFIKYQLNEDKLPEYIYHYEIRHENQESINDYLIINTETRSTTRQFSLFQPLLDYPNCHYRFKEPLPAGISTIFIKSNVEKRNPSIQIRRKFIHLYHHQRNLKIKPQ